MDFIYGLTSFLTVILIVTLIIGLVRPDALKKKGGVPIKRGPLLGGSLVLLAIFSLVLNATEPAGMKSSVNNNQTQHEHAISSTKKLKTVPIDKVEIKEETSTESIPFTSTTQNDGSLPSGQTKVIQVGINGTKTITYKVTYTDGNAARSIAFVHNFFYLRS